MLRRGHLIKQFLIIGLMALLKADDKDPCHPQQIHLSIGDVYYRSYPKIKDTEYKGTPNERYSITFYTKESCPYATLIVKHNDKQLEFTPVLQQQLQIINNTYLPSGNLYQYQIAGKSEQKELVGPFEFYGHTEKKQDGLKFVLFGNLAIKKSSENTLKILTDLATNNKTQIFSYIHLGGIALNLEDRDGLNGDEYFQRIQGFAAQIPYLAVAGKTESANNFRQFQYRFNFPQSVRSKSMYYSFNAGRVHFISFSLEYVLKPENIESFEKWLLNDLYNAEEQDNNLERPWTIVLIDSPLQIIDVSDKIKEQDDIKKYPQLHIYLILFEHNVDLIMSGGLHTYSRIFHKYDIKVFGNSDWAKVFQDKGNTTDLKDNKHVFNFNYPIEIIEGVASPHPNYNKSEGDAFKNDTEFQDERAGYGVLNVINDTHIEYEHYESQNQQLLDKFILQKTIPHTFIPFKYKRIDPKNTDSNEKGSLIWVWIIVLFVTCFVCTGAYYIYKRRKLHREMIEKGEASEMYNRLS